MTDKQPEPRTGQKGILCAKCEHLNPPGLSSCEYCDAHLYVVCHSCGERAQRVLSKCPHCRSRLHHSFPRRMMRKFLGNYQGTFWVILLLVLGIGLAFGVVVFLAEIKIPGL